ncbi:hypothetical protein CVT26_003029 [Gymnopilus dilepis]|uniref:Extracellular metalloproteinase n=1 Tax=Gymnopilus dilepis TaxID=231916 RepID=A0A409W2K1_9AGAR|nr:hypothetical protein CVT26_003029 [Gymnopilus dilepis]
MTAFRRLFRIALLAIALASESIASALPTHELHATHRAFEVAPDLSIEAFHPPSSFETFQDGLDFELSKRDGFSLKDAAVAFASSRLSKNAGSVSFKSGFSGDVSHHAFLTQTHVGLASSFAIRQRPNSFLTPHPQDGIPFANAVANVAFNKNEKVVAFGSSFVKPKSIASSTPSVSISDAITIAEKALGGTFNGHSPTLEFFAKPDGTAVLTHVIQIEKDQTGAWFEAFVDAHAGTLVSITDFVSKASYLVLPMQEETLLEGFEVLANPSDPLASPLGWHNTGTANTTGNNAVSFKGAQTATTTESSAGLNFIFTQDPNSQPSVQANVDAARTNAFYVVNTMHDLTYRYGFTESAFNFQVNNFGKGGVGNDQVTISVQDSSGTNNANFATPPDGQSGRMRMFLWTFTTPMRDGALENDIVTHENTHGVTNRMTGGGTGRCLQTTEAGGMGEGWSDAMANWNEKTSAAVPDYVLGQYVINNPAGIRTHPYSTNATTNPLRYSDLQTRTEVHAIGEIWANMLHNVYANLVGAHGWSPTARANPTGSEGNIVFLHLFLDALALQPCNPTFLSARDAWLQADVNRFGGANACLIWKAFASRGLGVNAANHVDDTTLPPACVST